MRGWRTLLPVAAVALAGAAGTVAVAVAVGMPGASVWQLAVYLIPATATSLVSLILLRRALRGASLRQRFVAAAVVAVATVLANLFVLTRTMFVSKHDASVLAVLLLYSAGIGVAAALFLARATSEAVGRLGETARSLGDGDLNARVGALGAGTELDRLGRTMDQMAERLQQAIARERRIEASRRDLMTAVSHDLRTPLASLRAMIEAIDEGVVEDVPSLRRYAAEMRRSVTALVEMVDDLFELAQVDAGSIESETDQARLADVVRAAVGAVQLEADEKGLRLHTDLGSAADVACSPRLVRVLQNLLVNAVRHTPSDGTVRIEARCRPDSLEVAVADTGEGIEAEHLAHVFDPFYRGDPARSGAGAGLGLALARRIVETMGGRIDAVSRPAEGARFAVEIPR